MKFRRPRRKIDANLLRRLWPTRISDPKLAERLGHGRGAVRRKAKALGLRPRREIWNEDGT